MNPRPARRALAALPHFVVCAVITAALLARRVAGPNPKATVGGALLGLLAATLAIALAARRPQIQQERS